MSSLQHSVSRGQRMSLDQLIQTAERLQASGNPEEAVNLYRQWLSQSKDEDKCVALFNYGWLLQKLNKFGEAVHAQHEFAHQYASYLSGGHTSMH